MKAISKTSEELMNTHNYSVNSKMKKRYFLILLMLACIYAASPAFSQETNFGINDRVFVDGQTLVISGNAPSGNDIAIRIFGPDGTINVFEQITVNDSGSFGYDLTWPKASVDYPFGIYTLEVIDLSENSSMSENVDIHFTAKKWEEEIRNQLIEPPLKQFQSGITFDEIQCKESLSPIQKYDGSPACVKLETKRSLIERGWTGAVYPSGLTTMQTKPDIIVQKPSEISLADLTEHVNANNHFALDFYSKIVQEDNTNNVFFSPTSMSTAFSVLYEGSRQDTAREIQTVFGFSEDDQRRQQGYMSMQKSLGENSNDDVQTSIANALWLAHSFEPLAEYTNTAAIYYDSTIDRVDFASDDGVDKINKWVDEKTQGKITELLKPGSTGANTRMAITNAIYFNGLWEYPFDPKDNYEWDFMVNKDNSVKVQMMTFPHKMKVNYTVTENMQMIELPYRNGTVSMVVILPNEIDGLKSVEEDINAENLKKWMDTPPKISRGINIHVPKFSLEAEYDLKKTLPDMGMPSAFDQINADLSGITGYKNLYVSQAIHKAFVEVNEEGTEAAGATAIVTDESGGPTFRADHPFVFLIQDNDTGQILFMGRVMDPTR